MAMPKGYKTGPKEEVLIAAAQRRKKAALAWAAKFANSNGPLPIGDQNVCWL